LWLDLFQPVALRPEPLSAAVDRHRATPRAPGHRNRADLHKSPSSHGRSDRQTAQTGNGIDDHATTPLSAWGGLDGLVFTADIGEHAPSIRSAVCTRLAWLGLRFDDAANTGGADRTSSDSAIEVRVTASDEEAMIPQHTHALMRH
jgi:acetate kinase